MDTAALLRQAGRIVREAGARLEDRSLAAQVRAKGPTDFVTAVDTEVQEQIRARLQALDGTIQFMAEEKDNAAIDPARPVWVLDPVDGTTNLIHGFRHSAIALALAEGGRVCLGLVFDPFAGELFAARRGGGAFCNGRPIHASGTVHLADSTWRTASARWGPILAGGRKPAPPLPEPAASTTAATTSAGSARPPSNCAIRLAAVWMRTWSTVSNPGTMRPAG